ncbi:hypothetical protein BKA56DRAFT_434289, partial [Ilyonectria sp. MPI-CAGE-AT-0026]
PKYLWRVTHSGSRSWRDPTTGDLIAADRARSFSDEADLKQAISHHIDWWNRQPNCFLSVFSDERHARNWAEQRDRTSPTYIHKIDTTMLPTDACLFDLNWISVTLGISHPFASHEFLILHHVSARSIIST